MVLDCGMSNHPAPVERVRCKDVTLLCLQLTLIFSSNARGERTEMSGLVQAWKYSRLFIIVFHRAILHSSVELSCRMLMTYWGFPLAMRRRDGG